MNFATHYKPHKSLPEKNSGEIIVERAGYVPAKKRIENILNAGQRLKEFREDQFDFRSGESIPEDYIVPTRRPNYDMADAYQESEYLRARFLERKKARDEAARIAAAESDKNAENAAKESKAATADE